MCAKRLWGLALLIIPLLLVACGDNGGNGELSAEELARLPTLIPTRTPTDIPSETPVPTETSTPTAGPPTETPLPTLTFTPMATNTPILTSTPSITPTNTLLPSATPQPPTPTSAFTSTPLPSPTIAPSLTPAGPSIQNFTSSASQVPGGTGITLTWQAVGDTAIIEQLDASQTITQTFNVAASGTINVNVPQTGPQVTYRLRVSQSGNQVTRDVNVIVETTCPTPWFFQNAPADAGCPLGPAQTVQGKLQQFQNGIMINLTFNGQNKVYGFNTVDNLYAVYVNTWDGTSTYSDAACGAPPQLLLQPQDVFNWMYYQQSGTFGKWCNQGTGIGWAVQAFNGGATFRVQQASTGTLLFVEIPNFGIVRVAGQEPIGSWSRIQQQQQGQP